MRLRCQVPASMKLQSRDLNKWAPVGFRQELTEPAGTYTESPPWAFRPDRKPYPGPYRHIAPSRKAVEAFELGESQRDIKRLADGLLMLSSFTILPDVTTSSLSISDGRRNDPGLKQTTLGGGFTVSKDLPLYLEGNLGW